MTRFSFLLVFAALMAFSFRPAHGASEITLDDVTNLLGGDTVEAGKTIRFTFRLINTDGNIILGSSNGFRVWTHQNGAYTDNFSPITYDTLSVGWTTMYDGGFFFNPFSVDGIGEDTIGFAGFGLLNLGIPDGFDEQVWWIETGNLQEGDTICIDSSRYPPGGNWLWSTDNVDELIPDWGGRYCYHVQGPSGVKAIDGSWLPETYFLSQNYPNPFNPTTEINFEIPVRSHVTLTVYNVIGQKLKTLVDKELSPNRYVADWDGTSDNGTKVASGVYFYKLEAGDFTETKKMILLK